MRDFLYYVDMKNYFELSEFIKTSTGVENVPTFEIVMHLMEMLPLLNELRELWGSAIIISSGFRCSALNKKVGGVATSSHLFGWAVDLQPANGDMDGFIKFCYDFFKNRTDFDQCIIEQSGNTKWVHVGYKRFDGTQRKRIFDIIK